LFFGLANMNSRQKGKSTAEYAEKKEEEDAST
jgi:hypothetical protein